MRVCVVGAGYVGLVSAAGLAAHGHDVVCVDADHGKVAAIADGRCPIHEAGLEDLLRRHVDRELTATTDLATAAATADLVLLCVGTPSTPDGAIDTTALLAAAAQVGAALATRPAAAGPPVVVVKSTVVPGTTDGPVTDILTATSGRVPGEGIGIGANPEFLTEGQALADFLDPDRIVIGGDGLALAALRRLYADFPGVPVLESDARTAEMTKYASNAMLAAAISFANEIAILSDAVGGIDTAAVMRGVHASRYLTTPTADGPVVAGLAAFYEAGCGYGGSCLPKDVAALAAHGRSVGASAPLLAAVAAVNALQPARLVDVLRRELAGVAGRRVTVLGLAFKPDTDDVRESPAFPVLELLLGEEAHVTAHDPVVGPDAVAALPGVNHVGELDAAVKDAAAVVIITRWAEYQAVPGLVSNLDPPPLVVDGRRILDPGSVPWYAAPGLSLDRPQRT